MKTPELIEAKVVNCTPFTMTITSEQGHSETLSPEQGFVVLNGKAPLPVYAEWQHLGQNLSSTCFTQSRTWEVGKPV